MPSSCFVPFCNSGYNSCKEDRKLFRAPKNPKLFGLWEKQIRRKDRRLRPTDYVCELHFEEHMIQKWFIHIIRGEAVKIPRAKVRLVKDAIPTKFPDVKHLKSEKKNSKKRLAEDEELLSVDSETNCIEPKTVKSSGRTRRTRIRENPLLTDKVDHVSSVESQDNVSQAMGNLCNKENVETSENVHQTNEDDSVLAVKSDSQLIVSQAMVNPCSKQNIETGENIHQTGDVSKASESNRRGLDLAALNEEFNLETIGRMNFSNLARKVFVSEENSYRFCFAVGLLSKKRICASCGDNCTLEERQMECGTIDLQFYCSTCRKTQACRKKFSIRKNTFIDGSRLEIWQILAMAYCFVHQQLHYSLIQRECSLDNATLSESTISDWLNFFRQVCLVKLTKSEPEVIGGPGMTVEVDEGLLGKNRWVVGGVCWEMDNIFVVTSPLNTRTTKNLLDIISQHVHPESTVITDCWKNYSNMTDVKWKQLIRNHCPSFVDPTVSMQILDNIWLHLKQILPAADTKKEYVMLHFGTYLWQRKFLKEVEEDDFFMLFLQHIKEVFPT